jgi:hypothetical protein
MRSLADPAFYVFAVTSAIFAVIGAIALPLLIPHWEGATESGFTIGYVVGLFLGWKINELVGLD